MNIFEGVNKEHILKAKEKIDLEGVPDRFKGRDYAVDIEGKEYPFKYLLSIAYDEANGKTLNLNDFGSSDANRKKFERLYNFKILTVNTMSSNNVSVNTISINELIGNYKDLIRTDKYNELYKWEVVKRFQDNWDAGASDFTDMLSKSLQPEGCNLWLGNQYYPRKMITSIANKFPEDVRGMFNDLYNEDLDLGERVNNFARSAEKLLALAEPDRKLSTYQDKRAIMVYLTLMYPDKYYLYKNRMFNDFCEITGMKERPGKSKKGDAKILIDFLELCSEVKKVLVRDKDLIDKHIKRLDFSKDYKEKEYNLLTQDFIYCATTYLKNEPTTVNEKPIIMEKEQNKIKTDDALNVILYGPPGTGKTYNTIDKAVEIITGSKSESHEENKKTFEELRKDKQIDFVTFHQSYSYEDFVEGIKPKIEPENTENAGSDDSNIGDIKYEKTKGIFYDINSLALAAFSSTEVGEATNNFVYNKEDLNDVLFYKMSLGNTLLGEDEDIYKYCIKNNCIGLGWGGSLDYTNANSEKEIRDVMEKEKVDVRRYELFAVKCFKTWMRVGDIVFVSNGNYACRAIGKIESDYYYESNNDIRYHHFRKVKWILKDVNIPVNELYGKIFSQQTIYQMYTHLVKKDFFLRFKSGKKNVHDKYVLIIDEINRGNISNIFGELISLIEKDKRFGAKEALTVKLPYSKADFSVAPNLYLVGTMNSADRSVEALDTALRRRFSFVEMVPDPDVIEKVNGNTTIDGINIVDVFNKLNERIEKLLDRDHLIGHSYFLNIKTLSDLKLSFANNIIPLLQEYFYGDYGKIGLILGNGFISVDENSKNIFAKFADNNDLTELLEKKIFRIESAIEMDDEKFKDALTQLLN